MPQLSMSDMHKILLQIALQKAQAYSVQYGEHFCNARWDKSLRKAP